MIEFKPAYRTTILSDYGMTKQETETKDKNFKPKYSLPKKYSVIDRISRVHGSRFKSRLILD